MSSVAVDVINIVMEFAGSIIIKQRMSNAKSSKRESPSSVTKPKKQLKCRFEVNQKILQNIQCFIRMRSVKADKKRTSRIKSAIGVGSTADPRQTHSRSKETQPQRALIKKPIELSPQTRKQECSESPDVAKTIMNEVISSIEKEGVSSLRRKDSVRPAEEDLQLELDKIPEVNIWESPNCCYKSSVSTQRTIFSSGNVTARNSYYNGAYLMVPVQPFSFNSSFEEKDKDYFEGRRTDFRDRERDRLRLFDINYDAIQKDGRTTVMIKNIPNRYTLPMLADEIDETFKECYDFLYLPFDLDVPILVAQNNCNVGYAFINLLDHEILKRFYKHFNHRRWLKFRSEKICALAYARLQGRQDLIEHFSNSKVLNQKEKRYRPIIKPITKQSARLSDLIESQRKLQADT